ncbi:16S rRNA (guanine(966)-N(2))-methyltransferase RsmD [Paracoccus sp. 1_MG-2023]|uniref:16S rRNA (guanine(966)-N(2))-methyltransferase RsmD n=1 Tax=unclassified Paracoccus (in: a-proteobacteria) TaxID=2688777 RepID=UPI001C086A56|nr:16S rRNA (guanine(966)-N(2))-methyltransferase RsmD [Paracoccus sp. 1_MG-2023]MBU2957061.1 16S rRNA (guanine(966)-N(2))-methyltransferase RsmD [Paracoccus sp. C2R09]MDO6668259.1 16S rRNA (guanine(966)-N(2))-methyltransferase RsmD [Paracoccus sp. 1_MG-2023]
MRIVGGSLRGLKLADLGEGDMAAHLRPTTDRVRESIFNLLINGSHGNPLPGARVLDLFAGTGALGLEALSRGASHVTFVDDGVKSRALIRQNVEKARAQGSTDLWRRDATKLGEIRGKPFGMVFLDPPYGQGKGELAMASALEGGWLAPGATVLWEEARPPLLPAALTLLDQRSYGDTVVTLARLPLG